MLHLFHLKRMGFVYSIFNSQLESVYLEIKNLFRMKFNKILVISLLGLILGIQAQAQNLESHLDSISYALGLDLGKTLSKMGAELNSDLVYEGLSAVLADEELMLTEQEVESLMRKFQKEMQDAQVAMLRKEGDDFLAANKEKEGIMVTESGLQYEVMEEGTGESPASAASTVEVHYEGKLLNGKIFDSSYQRGTPAQFPLNRVISGWTEGLQLMKEGAKYRFYIPFNLAYGARGNQGIPPYSTLIFDVELLKVVENPE
jgi:FKBP-type peptidyl-prolyl cis-trans isomerase FklB